MLYTKYVTIDDICRTLNIPNEIAYRLFIPYSRWINDNWATKELRAIKFIGNGTLVHMFTNNMNNWAFYDHDYKKLVKRYRQLDEYSKVQINNYIYNNYDKKNKTFANQKDKRTCLFPFLDETIPFNGKISTFTRRELVSSITGDKFTAICITVKNVTSTASPNIQLDHISMIIPMVVFDKLYRGKLFVGDTIDFVATVKKYNNDRRYGITNAKILKAISN